MRTAVLSLALLALIVQGECSSFGEENNNRHLLQGNSARASASSTAISSGPDSQASSGATAESRGGESEAIAFASSETQTEVENIIIRAFKNVQDKVDPKNCEQIITEANIEVEAQSKAVATAYSTTFGEVRVDGEGSACADASASGSTEAATFVDVLTKAVASQPGSKTDASAESTAQVISAAVVSAFTEAFSTTCTKGGFGRAEQESFAQAVATPMVQVIVLAIAGSSCRDEVAALSKSIGEGSSMVDDDVQATTTGSTIAEGDTTAESGGDAGAATDVLEDIDDINAIEIQAVEKQCRFPFATCCSFRFEDQNRCSCSLNPNNSRCDAKKISSSQTSRIVWEDKNGSRCFCR